MESEAIVFDSQATAAEFETETLVDLITASGTEQEENDEVQMIEVDPDTTVYETEADSDDEVLEVPKKKKKAPEGKTPEIVKVCYSDYIVTSTNRTAKCKKCGVYVADGKSSTGNWARHLKTAGHENLKKTYDQYLSRRSGDVDNQWSISQYTIPADKWNRNDPKQTKMRRAWTEAIVMCGMPLSVTENKYFRTAIEASQPKFRHIDRNSVKADINSQFTSIEAKVKAALSVVEFCSVTIDMWSDRNIESYMGLTTHFVHNGELQSALLCVLHFEGRHTGIAIRDKFQKVCEHYDIENKISYAVSDNAANMKKAFETTLVEETEDATAEVETIDNGDLWNPVPDVHAAQVSEGIVSSHIRCFSHSLQLTVRDGLKQVQKAYRGLGKCSKISSLLHSSGPVKEAFKDVFSKDIWVPSVNETRWNSTYIQLRAILDLDQNDLKRALDRAKQPNLKFSNMELSTLMELKAILKPFYKATIDLQGEKAVTISGVLPTVLILSKHLQNVTVTHLHRMKGVLKDSLSTRFAGIFQLSHPMEQPDETKPFADEVFLISTLMDPKFGMGFFAKLHMDSPATLHQLAQKAKDILIDKARAVGCEDGAANERQTEPAAVAAAESQSIFDEFFSNSVQPGVSLEAAVESVMSWRGQGPRNALQFWSSPGELSPLQKLAWYIFCVPATSAPVERVFSVGGNILTPRRNRLSTDMLSKLMIVKCNKMYGQ